MHSQIMSTEKLALFKGAWLRNFCQGLDIGSTQVKKGSVFSLVVQQEMESRKVTGTRARGRLEAKP